MFDWITDTIGGMGYPGIVLLMFLENVFPPIPSELVMPAAGFAAARGELSFTGVLFAGTFGSLLGALPWYYAGRFLGNDRLQRLVSRQGRWLAISSSEIAATLRWFERHGGKIVFAGRLVPTVRTLISVPAGVASMQLPAFLICSAAGTLLWTGTLAWAGFMLGDQYEKIGSYLGPVSTIVVMLIVLTYIYRVMTFKRHA